MTAEEFLFESVGETYGIYTHSQVIKAMQEYSDIQVKETKQTILDYLHTNQNDCLDDGEYKAFEKMFEFIEKL